MDSWILRFTLVDRHDEPILVRVSRKEAGQLLDLDLLATDGDNAYRGKVRYSKLQKSRAPSYDGSDEDWLNILQHVLLLDSKPELPTSVRGNLDCTCDVRKSDKKPVLSIILRTRVEDITHRLGSIELKHTDNTDDVDLFAWTNHVLQSRDGLLIQARKAEDEIGKAAGTIKTLENQLQDLFQAKSDHETQLLQKFTILLNEKKLRIRVQQRQLIDGDHSAKASASGRTSNYKRKRESTEVQGPDGNVSDESQAFQDMDINSLSSSGDLDNVQSTASESDKPSDQKLHSSPIGDRLESPDATPPPRTLPFQSASEYHRHGVSSMKIDSVEKRGGHSKSKEDDRDDRTSSDSDDEL